MNEIKIVKKKLYSLKNKEKAKVLSGFFKTGKGEYGEGDQFLGIVVPVLRKLSKEFKDLKLSDTKILLDSKFHEERALGTFILVLNYQSSLKEKAGKRSAEIFNFYFKNIKAFNNWDLVDLSAPYISGHYFFHYKKDKLDQLVNSKDLWKRRIAIISMFYFIRQNDFQLPLKIIEKRLYDSEDLMHKACGWMLREIGKRNQVTLTNFLDLHADKMPRMALRYSIEKLSEDEKKYYMKLKDQK